MRYLNYIPSTKLRIHGFDDCPFSRISIVAAFQDILLRQRRQAAPMMVLVSVLSRRVLAPRSQDSHIGLDGYSNPQATSDDRLVRPPSPPPRTVVVAYSAKYCEAPLIGMGLVSYWSAPEP